MHKATISARTACAGLIISWVLASSQGQAQDAFDSSPYPCDYQKDYYVEAPATLTPSQLSSKKLQTNPGGPREPIKDTQHRPAEQQLTSSAAPWSSFISKNLPPDKDPFCDYLLADTYARIDPFCNYQLEEAYADIDPFCDETTPGIAIASAEAKPSRPLLIGATNTVAAKPEAFTTRRFRFGAANHCVSPIKMVPESDKLSNFLGTTKIIFTIPHPSIAKIAQALKDHDAPTATSIHPATVAPLFKDNAPLQEVLALAEKLERRVPLRVKHYEVFASLKTRGAIQKTAPTRRVLWAEIHTEVPVDDLTIGKLYDRAAELQKDKIKQQILLGKADCFRKNWDSAWHHFESIFARIKDDAFSARQIADTYQLHQRDMESCIWLSRYLRVAPDWQSFSLAFNQRSQIEQRYADQALKNERGSDFCLDSSRMPLRVCFGNSEQFTSLPESQSQGLKLRPYDQRPRPCDQRLRPYDQRLSRAFRYSFDEWNKACGGKLSFVETNDPANAEIICQWNDSYNQYNSYLGENQSMPKAAPSLTRLGETSTSSIVDNKNGHGSEQKSSITIFAYQGGSQRNLEDHLLRAICIHELGHALGIQKHLQDPGAIMYPQCDETHPHNYLSQPDMDKIAELYKRNPIVPANIEEVLRSQSTPIYESSNDEPPILVDPRTPPQPVALLVSQPDAEPETPGAFIQFQQFDLAMLASFPSIFH